MKLHGVGRGEALGARLLGNCLMISWGMWRGGDSLSKEIVDLYGKTAKRLLWESHPGSEHLSHGNLAGIHVAESILVYRRVSVNGH